ncbi:hypothetical protein LWC34_14815 [Kibdelosporangium philippinense]|uniref:DUF4870 domain-containing protein n=1 Tax=Kibdelosporangium philippinense TaxID=211113 RepID=A0ABS8Z873_9PSEU|nr:hypothetical protein [Kibdelosporangium philippinense]MCE7004095.1 hypothetical protein [Kibdelosporangium philippinense]
MVQVDVIWGYGFGSGLATAATYQLTKRRDGGQDTMWASKYTTAMLLFIAVAFAPSGLWLLFSFPDWETMQVAHVLSDMPVWLLVAFGVTSITQGILGFAVTRWLVQRGKPYLGYLQSVFAYAGFFFVLVHGWDGRGYQRFFSEGYEVFATWPASPTFSDALSRIGDWFSSPVALTLAVMTVILLPLVLWMTVSWLRDGQRTAVAAGQLDRERSVGALIGWYFVGTWVVGLITAITASVIIHFVGWWIGVPITLALAYFGVFRTGTGVAWHVYRQWGLPPQQAGQPAANAARHPASV